MTRDEITQILAILTVSGIDFKGDSEQIIRLWAEMFENDDFGAVKIAVKKLLATEKQLFQNGLIAKIKDLLVPADLFPDSATAWNLVRNAMKDGRIYANFKILPLIVKQVIGGADVLSEWYRSIDENTLNTVIKSNFMKEYNNLCRILKEDYKSGGSMLKQLKQPEMKALSGYKKQKKEII